MVEPAKAGGIVEQFGLRTTVLSALNGRSDLRAEFAGHHRHPEYARLAPLSIELLTSDPDEARRAIESVARRAPVGEARFLRPPEVVEERELGEGAWLVRGRADVAPKMEWLAEGLPVGALKSRLRSDALFADPIVYTLDEGSLSRYERRVLVSSERVARRPTELRRLR
jgi:hypothetical protein